MFPQGRLLKGIILRKGGKIPLEIFFRTPKKSQAVEPRIGLQCALGAFPHLDTSWKLLQGRCALHVELPSLSGEQGSECSALWPTEGEVATPAVGCGS